MSKIKINFNDRALGENPTVVGRIVKSYLTIGDLLSPILIDEDYNLISGYQRFLSYKKLGKDTIPVRIISCKDDLMKKYIELSENIDRQHFTYLTECKMLTLGKEVYDKLNEDNKEKKSFHKDVSGKTGETERNGQIKVKLYNDLGNINEKLLPLLHKLENNLGFRHTRTELKSVVGMEEEKLNTFVSILSDIVKKNIKKTKDMRLKKILLNLDSYESQQKPTPEEILQFQIYEFCKDKPKFKDFLGTIDIDLVKYEKFEVKLTKDFKNLIKFLEKGTK